MKKDKNILRCALCGKPLPPGKRRFCCNKHKDRYHNITNPRGFFSHLKDKDLKDTKINEIRDYEIIEWDHGDNGCL